MTPPRKQTAVHPGEVLTRQYLEPLGVSQYRLAKDISVPARRVNEIVLGKRAISADTALRFARYFGTTEAYWMELQANYDVEIVRAKLGPRLAWEVVVRR
jgi:addiction module HigA family antidote